MATNKTTLEYILDQISSAGDITAKKMFGEYVIYCNNVFVALICDDLFFVKPTTAGQELIGECEYGIPYPNAKPHLLIGGEELEHHQLISELIRVTYHELQYSAKPKAKRTKK